ncbi:MlaD family protein, partial [Salmonella enterica subsp. enterica serovar Lubbock]|nr:MlaD family protein [Salmonella enterica subsp. enterica serovar Lubbock]
MSQETPASKTEAQIKTKRRISPFWLLPLIALMIAGWLVWDSYQDRGNSVTIDFMSADGIVPGRTPVRYQGVEVGTVEDVSLSKDLRKIEVRVSIKSDMEDALREETQFWLVTPKASLAGVSGLDALVGGNYIGMMPGKGKPRDHFVALDTQPKYRLSNGDLMIHLNAPDLGSLNSGSLVYFRKIPVGRVYDYSINPNKQGVTIDVLIERRFTDLVKKGSRFWNVSGIDADLSLSGAKVKLESLAALVNGAIAFDSPDNSKPTSSPWYMSGVDSAFRPSPLGSSSLTITPRWLWAKSLYKPNVSSWAAGLELSGESNAIAPLTRAARLSSFTFAPLRLRSA